MANTPKRIRLIIPTILLIISTSLLDISTSSRTGQFSDTLLHKREQELRLSIASRLRQDNVVQECWDSLMELRSCTGEVILFLLNGKTYLGPSCCRAIRVIEHHCWAAEAMLSALGFTPQEGDMLRDYCDSTPSSQPPVAPSPLLS